MRAMTSPWSWLPRIAAIIVAVLWFWGAISPYDDSYETVRAAAIVVTAPASVIAYVVVDSRLGDSSSLSHTTMHLLWLLLAYLQWHLIAEAPRLLAGRKWAIAAGALAAIALAIVAAAGVVKARKESVMSEHGFLWHIQRPLWLFGFAIALGVLVLLAHVRSTRGVASAAE